MKKHLKKVLEDDGLNIAIEYSLKITYTFFSAVTIAFLALTNI